MRAPTHDRVSCLQCTQVLQYGDALASRVDSGLELSFGSEVAVDALRQHLATRGVQLLAIEVDWLLWNEGERCIGEMAPHHKTLTVYYRSTEVLLLRVTRILQSLLMYPEELSKYLAISFRNNTRNYRVPIYTSGQV